MDCCQGDITDPDAVRRATRGVRCVIHCAGDVHIGWRNLDRQRRVNVLGTRVIAQSAREVGARLVHVSTVEEENRLIAIDDEMVESAEYRSMLADFDPDLDRTDN